MCGELFNSRLTLLRPLKRNVPNEREFGRLSPARDKLLKIDGLGKKGKKEAAW
jgi:hypothetical protein